MDKKEIDALEPKFTGNQRELTEGEAAAIKADPANNEKDDVADSLSDLPIASAFGLFKRT